MEESMHSDSLECLREVALEREGDEGSSRDELEID